ncbi:glycosyltransferase family 4 protein [Tamlana sp. 2_MG-2023]|uniref:glycosyltransferase family 4 protein n=1 Tax=unclassified Tamlana TaxID=2614803 RepID=UPI0026E41327|nr:MULTISPECIES: glycosyltransferase family 4 protein [unclassified Tamlana]MDO6759564.1 glycosyltransferase family 4 protein [Tamlana sp. 2_MG-2023]MDO6790297.1 glycosyltransferase family 4 protein [Tamlana sp. 1_MG-2023]
MKLLYIVNQLNGTTGQERIIAIKTDYFIKEYNYDIVVIALEEEGDKPFFNVNSAIKKYNLSKGKDVLIGGVSKMKQVNKILEDEIPDVVVVVVDNISGLYMPNFLSKKFKYVYERHNSKSVNYTQNSNSIPTQFINKVKKALLDQGGRGYDKVVLLSDDHIEEWKYLKNIEIISNPLIFYPESYASLENKRVLAVGRHTHQKGFDFLIKSWSEVVKTHKDWTLDIYGKKDEYSKYINMAEDYGVSEYINFHEPVSDIMSVYLESSIYALSSRFEGFPLVLIETMACGVPAVAFNCPCGVKELITDGEDGYLVEINDIQNFSQSLIKLIENPTTRKNMGAAARKNILRLSPESIFPKWKKLFEELSN